MKTIYNYICVNCWHTWRNKNNYTRCPKCGAPIKKEDRQEDILMADE